jgi:flagellar hook-length control protein FliK
MIDTSVNPLEAVVPAKPAEPQGRQFGKVLNEQRQPEKPQPAETKQQPVENRQAKQVEKQETEKQPVEKQEAKSQPVEKQEAKSQPAEKQDEKQAVKTADQPTEKAAEQAKSEQQVAKGEEQARGAMVAEVKSKLQQTIINLMKVIAGGETPELQEEFGSTEELLNQLVQQLEGTELKGEQVLAGIDLSTLVEQLQTLKAEGGEEQLQQLVVQLEEQLANEEGLLANAELAAAQLPVSDPQAAAPTLVENLAQARQILQKAIDAVAQQKTPQGENENAAVAELENEAETAEQDLFMEQQPAEEIDPRFADLLKPRSENRNQSLQSQQQQSLRQQVLGDSAKQPASQVVTADPVQGATEGKTEQSAMADFAEMLSKAPKQGMENLAQTQQVNQVQPNAAVQAPNLAAKVMPNSPMVQMPSGQQVAESQIFDQVVARFTSTANPESGKMILRMQPAELGSLRIELMVEGDRVRANLQAQTLQVQEVLERNLPQLRNALAEQGLKIDQFQVDVNRDQSQQQQFEQLAQQQQQRQGSQAQPGWQQPWESEEQIIPLAHLMENGGGGISLHV